MTVRTRFAPSPTGYLHLGGARTALFAWLYAKHHQGELILRIEDTDLTRSTETMVDVILEGLQWLGIDHDEGPYFQSRRLEHYQNAVNTLLEQGKAYRCYCSHERLEALREQQMANKQKPRYDGYCRHYTPEVPDAPHVIRFWNPDEGAVVFDDQIRGRTVVANSELDDLVIQRSDGSPTYNLSVVVDDAEMAITHVIRGDDHVNNTPRQINIMKALGYEPPVYAHVPMILGEDGQRLSKRHGAVNVLQYRDEGYLPQAMLNGLARLGWSYGDQEIIDVATMIQQFSFDRVSKSPAAINFEKLQWMNQHYLKTLPSSEVAPQFARHLEHEGLNSENGPSLEAVVAALCERVKTLKEMAQWAWCFYAPVNDYDEKAAKKFLRPVIAAPLRELRQRLAELEKAQWNQATLQSVVHEAAESFDIKMGKIAQPLRVALTGTSVSPPINQTLALVGQTRALARLDQALEFVNIRQS